MIDLKETRDRIDDVDKEIAALFEKRMRLVEKIAEYKKENHMDVVDAEREEEMIRDLRKMASSEFNSIGIRDLMQQIISISRKRQYQIQTAYDVDPQLDFEEIDVIYKDKRVVFQGVEGAYSYAAMYKYFGKDVKSSNARTFKDALDAIIKKKADFAVLPIENSTAGIVTDMYDLLMDYDISIVDEQTVKIEHNLVGLEETDFSKIKTVYSHPQALAQCKVFLDNHPEWEIKEYSNTAAAAKKVMEDKDPTQVAISSQYAAEIFNLKILRKNIFFDPYNTTRFVIVSRNKMFRSEANRVSICFDLKHSSGSLYNILSHIMYNGLNMTMIESRPIPNSPWEYRFFIDFEGNLKDAAVKNALLGIRQDANYMRILGNY